MAYSVSADVKEIPDIVARFYQDQTPCLYSGLPDHLLQQVLLFHGRKQHQD